MSFDPRKIAAQVIQHVLEHRAFSNIVLSNALDRSNLSERDKAFCTELVYGTLRWFPALKSSLMRAMDKPNSKVAFDLQVHLCVAIYQLQHLSGSIPAYAVVSSAVNLIKRKRPGLAAFANAVLRRVGSAPHLLLRQSRDFEQLSGAFGLPVFLLQTLPLTELFEAALAMNSRPKLWYRCRHSPSNQAQPHAFLP